MNIRFIGGLLSAYGLSKDEVGPIACPIRQARYAGGGWGGYYLHILLMLSTDMLDSPPRTNGLSLTPGLHSLSTCTQCVTHVPNVVCWPSSPTDFFVVLFEKFYSISNMPVMSPGFQAESS